VAGRRKARPQCGVRELGGIPREENPVDQTAREGGAQCLKGTTEMGGVNAERRAQVEMAMDYNYQKRKRLGRKGFRVSRRTLKKHACEASNPSTARNG